MNIRKGIPSLRIAVTEKCNMACAYCPKHGDSYFLKSKNVLNVNQFCEIVKIAHRVGIRHFSITGGEPLVVPELTFPIAKTISGFNDLGYSRLNTNGVLIKNYSNEIIHSEFSKVKVSLDSLRSKYFTEINDGIKILKVNNIPTRINMVVGQNNKNEIYEMIDFCNKNELELKFFDITRYCDTNSSDPDFWKDDYFSLLPLYNELKERYGSPEIVFAVGNYGNPMPVFKPNSSSPIRLRISEQKAYYIKDCIKCKDYMCQDGFCNITLSTDGVLKPCRPEGLDFNTNLFEDGKLKSDSEIEKVFKHLLSIFKSSEIKNRKLNEVVESWNKNIAKKINQ